MRAAELNTREGKRDRAAAYVAQPVWLHQRHDGASLFLHVNGVDFIVRLGGGQGPTSARLPATDTAEVLPTSGSLSFQWLDLGTMPGGHRQFPNAVVLPDESIVVIGGGDPQTGTVITQTVLFRLSAGVWQVVTGGDTPTRRIYHATAVLLPDGRVFLGGGEYVPFGHQTPNEHDYDIYVPHYLQGNPLRPKIDTVTNLNDVPLQRDPTNSAFLVTHGVPFRVRCETLSLGKMDRIDRLVLIAPGSITHHSDFSARYVNITGVSPANNVMQCQVPGNNTVPRGFYMLFALNTGGVPSVAAWVKVV